MKLSDFSFELPEELIAKFPTSPRDYSKLLVVERTTQKIKHRSFYELPEILRTNDLLVVNNTKVIPARLFGEDTLGKSFEIFLLKSLIPQTKHGNALSNQEKRSKPESQFHFQMEEVDTLPLTTKVSFKFLFPSKTIGLF